MTKRLRRTCRSCQRRFYFPASHSATRECEDCRSIPKCMPTVYLPMAPLLRYLTINYPECTTGARRAELIGISPRQFERIKAGGNRVQLPTADKLAVSLGVHPVMIWGLDFWTRTAMDKDQLVAEAV